MLFVGGFQFGLRRRQAGALRVIDQVQDQAAVGAPVAQRIQPSEPFEARLESARAALLVDVFLQVARQGGDDFDAMHGQKRRQVFMTGFLQYGQVAAVDHAQSARARGNDQSLEIAVQLGRTPGEIDGADLGAGGEKFDDGGYGFGRHLFRPIRSSIYVAVHATLVAAVTQVQLQRLDGAAREARESGSNQQGQGGVHDKYS